MIINHFFRKKYGYLLTFSYARVILTKKKVGFKAFKGFFMTLKEIAKKLNLSIATVSKALNGSTDISEPTRKLVCDYAESVGYRSRKSMAWNGRVALLWAKEEQRDKYSAPSLVATSFLSMAQKERYVVVEDVLEKLLEEDEKFSLNEYLARHHFGGAFLVGLNFFNPVYAQLKKTKYPLVLLDNYMLDNDLVSGVGCDNILSTEKAVDYLVSLGHKQIAFLGGERQSLVGAERLAGYILGLSKNGIEYRYDLTYFGDYTRQAGIDAADYFQSKDFTAIVCASDMMAIGLIDRLRHWGKKVPDDVSVIGFDDLEFLRYTNYDLTTMRQDFALIGEKAFRILESMIKGLPAQRANVGCTLIPRGSTIPLKQP